MASHQHRPAVVGAAAAVCLVAAGCSSPAGNRPAAAGTSGTSPSASPQSASPQSAGPPASSAPVRPPVLPEASRGPQGQRRFARYVIAVWGYSLRTDDPAPLFATSFDRRACGGCDRLAAELRRREREGWYVDFPGVDVHRMRLRTSGAVTVATASVSIPASDSHNLDGSFRNSNPAHPRARFVVRMRLVGDGYRLVSFAVS